MVRLLLAEGADVNAGAYLSDYLSDTYLSDTPLSLAAHRNAV